MKKAQPSLCEYQRDFAAYLRQRHPQSSPEGIAERPARLYRKLLFNNVSGTLDSCLPICRQLLEPERWLAMKRGYFREAKPHTPLLWEISGEFTSYLMENCGRYRLPPWLPELGHLEGMQLAVDNCDPPFPACRVDGDPLTLLPVVNPTAQTLAYTWPVHRISERAEPPPGPEPTLLVMWRDLDERVRIEQTAPATARLLEIISSGATSGQSACEQLSGELPQLHLPQLTDFVRVELMRMRELGLIIGCCEC